MNASAARIFKVLIAAMAVSTGLGLWIALSQRAALQEAFPGTDAAWVYYGLLATAGTGLVALGGLWLWRTWAVGLYAVVALVSLSLDVAAAAPVLHQATVLAGSTAILALAYANRARFGR